MNSFQKFLSHKAYQMRYNSLLMTTYAGSGHPTSALSAADIVAVLFFYVMNFDPRNPENTHNDRFILSKGHASPLLYAVYKELGVLNDHDLLTYRKFNSVLEGHPTARFAWAEAATGSLGQGLSIGIGMALAARMDHKKYYTYVLLGDSEIAEGSVWEAAEFAGYNKLHNLVAIIDVNRLGQTGPTMQGHSVEDYTRKFSAFGWQTFIVYGHDIAALMDVFDNAKKIVDKPTIIIAKTYKGFGVDVEDQNGYHGKVFSQEELEKIVRHMRQRFADVTAEVDYTWVPKVPQDEPIKRLNSSIDLPVPPFEKKELCATRKAFGLALASLGACDDTVVCLDAEVKNSTYTEFFGQQFPNRFIQSFIAEQNMIGMATGLQKRGKIPFAATFSAFYARAFDQIRMAAIGGNALRLNGSHAGVSIGQDGPSQMGLEDIALFRLIPNSIVLYPADAVSCWKLVELMANYDQGVSYIRTTRMETPIIYDTQAAFVIGGFTLLKESQNDSACLVAAGVTVFEALAAYEQLKKEGILVSVIDLYCVKPLDVQRLSSAVARAGGKMVSIEDHYQAGGIGEALNSALKNEGFVTHNLQVSKMPRSGSPEDLLRYEEIDAKALINTVKSLL